MWLTLAIVSLALASCGDARRGGHPADSVIVLTFDAMRADGLGAYGNPRRTSPSLDAFAADAWLFERAYSPAPITSASFVAMFTGRYPRKSATVWRVMNGPTIAEVFSDLGFRTAGFFANSWLQRSLGYASGFDHYEVRNGHDEQVLARGLAWAKRHRDERFFLWIHLLDPHIPWLRRPEAAHLYDPAYRGEFLEQVRPLTAITDPDALARAKDLYEGEIFHVDRLFRRFWRTIRRLDLEDRVAIVVSSDHGEELMEHGALQHGQLTDENLHVPLLIRRAGAGPARRVSAPVSTVDLLPTLLDLVGHETPTVAERSLLRPTDGRRPLLAVAEYHAVAIRMGTLKLILTCRKAPRHQLFDLSVDPRERHDLAASRPEALHVLERAALEMMDVGSCADYIVPPAGAPREGGDIDPETRRALEALGYVQDDSH